MQVLRLVCSCLQNAPASDTWDLSGLLVNDSPVSQQTVEAVLSVLYSTMGALNYEMDRTAGCYSLSQLLDMLLFADAVGCSRAVLGQLAGLLGSTVPPQLEILLRTGDSTVEVSSSRGMRGGRGVRSGHGGRGIATAAAAADAVPAKTVQLHLQKRYTIDVAVEDDSGGEYVLQHWQCDEATLVRHLNQQQAKQLQQQAVQHLEALLFVGFKLDLQQLLQPALRFLRTHADTFLHDMVRVKRGMLFMQRVLASANGACGAELLARACVQRPLGRGFGVNSLFGDVVFTENEEDDDALSFNATLLQDLAEWSRGTKLEVIFSRNGNLAMRIPGVEDSTTDYYFGVAIGPKHTFKDSDGVKSVSKSA